MEVIEENSHSYFGSERVELNATDEKSVASTRENNTQLPAAVRISKTSMLKFSIMCITLYTAILQIINIFI